VTDIEKVLGEARRLIDRGNFSDAITALELLAELNFEAAMLTGVAANRARTPDQALDRFACAIRMSPKHLKAWLNWALTFRALG
jgi:Flp pilus assembly protein TadD